MRNKKLIILLSVVSALVICVVICGATFLVRHVEAYNFYADSPDYDEQVIEAAGIKHNSSIFFLDEGKIKKAVEDKFYNIGVINIERKFPDRVSVNYVVYGNSFQYLGGDGYVQCYSSGRIGGSTVAPVSGYFIVKPRDAANSAVGGYFQDENGYDHKLIQSFIKYLRTTPMNDAQIAERIAFVDLSRDGYFYVRTVAGCSIEIYGTGSNFAELLDAGWSVFSDPNAETPVNAEAGTIRVRMNYSDPDHPSVRCTYSATDGEAYYLENYVRA